MPEIPKDRLKDCRETALSFLEHRERSAGEVASHLIDKGFSREVIDKELEYLKGLHYVDDERYCEDYFRYAMRKGRGPVRIRLELREKGIDEALIQRTLEEYFNCRTEKEAALAEAKKLLERSCGSRSGPGFGENLDEKTMAKIGRRLASMGYHADVIYDVIGQLMKSQREIL